MSFSIFPPHCREIGTMFAQSANKGPQLVRSVQDLTTLENYERGATKLKATTFYHISNSDELYFGVTSKGKMDTSIPEYNSALKCVPDETVWPEAPADANLTLAPNNLTEELAFLKRPQLKSYSLKNDNSLIPQSFLKETLIMEQLSKSPHPSLVQYLGYRVKRGRITAIWLERLELTLNQYVNTLGFNQRDKDKFVDDIESAVNHLHALGLAHNDINHSNIMIQGNKPILVGFGSCQPFGENLDAHGSPGLYENTKVFSTSEKENDILSLNNLRDWIKKLV
uniref:Protein kinase domain-containing protein n=1 Tax=Bionectria ochroleuca TaxID=29856 RepID=A0A8H7N2T2_BIOOC